jgi:hypothetical protein
VSLAAVCLTDCVSDSEAADAVRAVEGHADASAPTDVAAANGAAAHGTDARWCGLRALEAPVEVLGALRRADATIAALVAAPRVTPRLAFARACTRRSGFTQREVTLSCGEVMGALAAWTVSVVDEIAFFRSEPEARQADAEVAQLETTLRAWEEARAGGEPADVR